MVNNNCLLSVPTMLRAYQMEYDNLQYTVVASFECLLKPFNSYSRWSKIFPIFL
jgi:hypothetical protein